MRRAHLSWLALALLTAAAVARAQLPQVQVPGVQLPEVGRVVPATADVLDRTLRELSQARALRAGRLLRQHRAVLDRDPRGDLVIRAQVVAVDISAAALARAVQADFRELRSEELMDPGVKMTILQTPAGMSATRGLRKLRKLDPEGTYDFNHVYLDGGQAAGAATPGDASSSASAPGRVGLVDGGVDGAHRALAGIRLKQFGCQGAVIPSSHGTAVASILVSRRTVAELWAADVYCGTPTGGAVDAVASAFGWMARERVAVVNVSLVGPRNALLERVVKSLVDRGHVIVAAVGNDGPAAPPLYPASHVGVVGVTGVDGRHRVLIEAARGKHVDFAALGANVSAAAASPDQFAPVRGTSFAAPLVSALLATMTMPDVTERERLLAKLSSEARDLGKPGRDDTYGAGELGSYE